MPCIQTDIVNGQAILQNVWFLAPGEWRKQSTVKGQAIDIGNAKIYACAALIDTGAQVSCIAGSVAKDLGLVSKTKTPIIGIHGMAHRNVYDADLVLFDILWGQERISLIDLEVPENAQYHAIIGMDILQRGTLHFNYGSQGRSGVCTFCV